MPSPSIPTGRFDAQSTTSIDTLFKVLSHAYRRYALVCLREHRTMALADLADEVAAMAYHTPSGDVADDEVERVFRSLYHTHVPMLVSANLVDYDQTSATVAIRDAAREADPFLAMVGADADYPV